MPLRGHVCLVADPLGVIPQSLLLDPDMDQRKDVAIVDGLVFGAGGGLCW